jgi:DNA-binding transcriptional LysR family regulator
LHIAVFDKTASNPASNIAKAIALFVAQAPDVSLNLHVATLNAIERGVIDGQYQIGIIPGHRSSDTLQYDPLFGEAMLLYCGAGHPLFGKDSALLHWKDLRAYQFAGLGYHSPNMEISQRERMSRRATGFDQESIATLILSGRFLGFLPDHYAEGFVRQGHMQVIKPALFRYDCEFFAIQRRSPPPSRATRSMMQCLVLAHTK